MYVRLGLVLALGRVDVNIQALQMNPCRTIGVVDGSIIMGQPQSEHKVYNFFWKYKMRPNKGKGINSVVLHRFALMPISIKTLVKINTSNGKKERDLFYVHNRFCS
jgi:hypothetical protein